MLSQRTSSRDLMLMQEAPVWIMCHDSQRQLARDIVAYCKERSASSSETGDELQPDCSATKKTRGISFKPLIEWGKFHDGFPNLFIRDVKEMAGKDVIIIISFHSVDVIFEQISVLYALPRYLANSVKVILPYFPTGTMERIDLEGQVATAMTLASLLSIVPFSTTGPVQYVIFDIHALQERFYFSNSVIPRLESAVPLLELELCRMRAGEWTTATGVAIAFPDDGAQKRFASLFPTDHYQHLVCVKQRQGDKRLIRLKEGDPKGLHVVIVDDLVQTGGTLIEAAKLLRSLGALSVSAYVTHAVFPKESWRKFIAPAQTDGDAEPSAQQTTTSDKAAPSSVVLDNFWITDSVPHARHIATHPPFRLLSLAPLIADILLGYDLQQRQ